MVFGQELAGSIYQLRGPGIQATQVQFIEQFTMSLPNGQSGGMGILRLITPSSNCTSSGGLGTGDAATALAIGVFFWRVCGYAMLFLPTKTAFFTVLPKLGVHVLYIQALWQRAIFSSQDLYNDIDAFSSIGPSCLCWYDVGEEGLYGLCILGVH